MEIFFIRFVVVIKEKQLDPSTKGVKTEWL